MDHAYYVIIIIDIFHYDCKIGHTLPQGIYLTSKTESEKKKFPSQPGEENRAQIRTIFRLKKFTAYENFIIKKYWVSKSYLIQQKKRFSIKV